MKVTMIGITGSGKTSFMSALYGILGGDNSIKDFRIAPTALDMDIDTDILLTGQFQALDLATRNFKFPEGTTRTTIWSFDLRYRDKFICNFEWIDYRGGILENISSEGVQSDNETRLEIKNIIEHIALSNAVVLFADAYKLTYYSKIKEARHHSGANRLYQILDAYNQHHPDTPLVFIIVLTKVDEVDAVWKDNEYKALIERGEEVFGPTILMGKRTHKWVGGIIPVSAVGEGCAETTVEKPKDIRTPIIVNNKITQYPEPMNAGHALLYCLAEILRKIQTTSERNIQKYKLEIEIAQQGSKEIPEDILDKRAQEFRSLRQFKVYVDPIYTIAMEKVKRVC